MTQKELKQLYIETVVSEQYESKDSWRKFFKDTVGYVVELENGGLVALDKPSIEKDFCFGYSLSRYDSEDYDRATEAADAAMEKEDYFIRENMEQVDQYICWLRNENRLAYRGKKYGAALENSKIYGVREFSGYDKWNDRIPDGWEPLSDADRAAMLNGYKELRKAFEKRLKAYLKRYGLSKVHSWTYWQDA